MPACNDDDPAEPELPADLTLNVTCQSGAMRLELRNSGGAMAAADTFIVEYADDARDTLVLQAGAAETVVCELSNLHGSASVSAAASGLSAAADDCLTPILAGLPATVDLAEFIPSPFANTTIALCDYAVYLDDFTYAPATFELVPIPTGIVLRYIYRNLHGDLRLISNQPLCLDYTGDLTIGSVVIEVALAVTEGDPPTVTLVGTEATVSGMQISVDGLLGPVVSWIASFFTDLISDQLSVAIGDEIGQLIASGLDDLLVVQPVCGE